MFGSSSIGEMTARPVRDHKRGPKFQGPKAKEHLTRREKQVLRLIALGYKNHEIGKILGITENTVKVYYSKMDLELPRTLIGIVALRSGLVTLTEIDDRLEEFKTGHNTWFLTGGTNAPASDVRDMSGYDPHGNAD